ncbi:hypothetical protein FDB64_02045 [Clostridium botulinum]|nr:hypothetical protein [Clostridium botulinum]NFM03686.1 hypothetical protein [Clostridium botulinum]
MGINDERELLKNINNNSPSYFYYDINDVYMQSKVEEVKNEKNFIRIFFTGGFLDINKDIDIVEKVKRPDTKINTYEWCYSILNRNKKIKGWILKEAKQ